MENNKTNTKENNDLDEKYIFTLFNEFENSMQEGSIEISIKDTKPMVIENTIIYDYIKNNIEGYKNEYQVFRHFIYTLMEEQKTLSIE